MQVFYLYTAVVVLSPAVIQAAQKRFMLDVSSISCQNFSKNVQHFACGFRKVANGKFLFNSYFMYDRKFGKDFNATLRLSVTPLNGKVSYNLLDFGGNMCALTVQASNNILLRKMFNEWLRASNYPVDCVFEPNYMYKVENFFMTDSIFPVYAPFLNATITLELFKNAKIVRYIVGAALIPRKK